MNEALHQLALKRMVELRLQGMSTRKIAEALNSENLRGQKWGKWHPTTVLKELPGLGFDTTQPGVILIECEGIPPTVGWIYNASFHGKDIQGQVLSVHGNRVHFRVGDHKYKVLGDCPRTVPLKPGQLEKIFQLPENPLP